MKTCSACGGTFEESNFYKSKERDKYAMCKKCFSVYCIRRWIDKKIEAIKYLGGSCSRCGYDSFYGALEFHHKDPNLKDVSWNKLRLRSEQKIKQELDKCTLLCANCHREEHHRLRTLARMEGLQPSPDSLEENCSCN